MPRRPLSKRPPGKDTLERRAEQREAILDAADVVLRRAGPEASVNEIAAEAGVAKPIIYRHFGDKDGLLQGLTQRYATALLEQLRAALGEAGEPRARLNATIDSYLRFIEEHAEQYDFLMRRTGVSGARETVEDFIQKIAAEVAVELGEELRAAGIDSGPAEPWAHGLVGMVQLAGDWWLRNRTMPRHRLADYLISLLWEGFDGLQRRAAGG